MERKMRVKGKISGKNRIFIILTMLLIHLVTINCVFAPNYTGYAEGSQSGADVADTYADADLAAADKTGPPAGMETAAENDYLVLYINRETTEVAVKDKRTGAIWYSNPQNRSEESIASGANKLKLGSQLSIEYYNTENVGKTMDNYNDSIRNKQFEISKTDNGVKIVYTLGSTKAGKEAVPQLISRERFEKLILDKLTDEADKREIKKRYWRISINDALDEEEKEQMKKKYKNIEKDDIYELKKVQDFIIQKIIEILDKAGYTKEDLAYDNEENGIKAGDMVNEVFTIPLEYSLEKDNLVVRIPCSEIKYPAKLPLTHIKALEFFGAADRSQKGYIFVPDGSGALIYLNNGKLLAQGYNEHVYGQDGSVFEEEMSQYSEQAHLPVFGLKQGDEAFLGIIEEGDSLADICADAGGKQSSYNYVCTRYNIIPAAEMNLGDDLQIRKIMVYQARMYQGDIKLRYAFLHGDDAGYTGMAGYYRDYLVERDVLKKLTPEENIPFYIEAIGAIQKQKSIMGIPVNMTEPLTKYEEARKMVQEIAGEGIRNIKLKYTGWFNKGIEQTVPKRISLLGRLGGRKAFGELLSYLDQNNVEVYPDIAFLEIGGRSLNFSPRAEASRFIGRDVAISAEYDVSTMMAKLWGIIRYIFSPARLEDVVDSLIKDLKKYSVQCISLRDMGNMLNSDFKEKNLCDRQQAKDIIEAQAAKLRNSGIKIMANGGNAYVLPYAGSIVNMPLDSSHFNITDESVPFYQIVVHGFIEYAGEPVNLAQNVRKHMLKTIETGAGVYYTWIYRESSALKNTQYGRLYSTYYKDWMDEAVKLYNEVNGVFKDIQDKRIVGHEKLMENVYRTTYENGKSVIVNYNDEAVDIEGLTIEGENYKVVGR